MTCTPIDQPLTILGLSTCLLAYTFRADFVPKGYDVVYGMGSALTLVGAVHSGYNSRDTREVAPLANGAFLVASGLLLYAAAWIKEIPLATAPALIIASCGTYDIARAFARS